MEARTRLLSLMSRYACSFLGTESFHLGQRQGGMATPAEVALGLYSIVPFSCHHNLWKKNYRTKFRNFSSVPTGKWQSRDLTEVRLMKPLLLTKTLLCLVRSGRRPGFGPPLFRLFAI